MFKEGNISNSWVLVFLLLVVVGVTLLVRLRFEPVYFDLWDAFFTGCFILLLIVPPLILSK